MRRLKPLVSNWSKKTPIPVGAFPGLCALAEGDYIGAYALAARYHTLPARRR